MHLGDFRNSASSKPDRTNTLEGDGEQPCHETPEHFFIFSLIFKESTLAAQIAKARPSQTKKHLFFQTKTTKASKGTQLQQHIHRHDKKGAPSYIFFLFFFIFSRPFQTCRENGLRGS